LTADARVAFVSENCSSVLGLPAAALIDGDPLEVVSLEARLRLVRWLALLRRRPRPFKDLELPLALADGRRLWISVSGLPHRDAAGRLKSFRGVARDVTMSRDAAERLKAATVASAALLANSKLQAKRRNEGKALQEAAVAEALRAAHFEEVRPVPIKVLEDGPKLGQFCRETLLGTRKADIVVRLWDRRVMAIECKVSNSFVNSIKRLNNDAAAKGEAWLKDFGARQVVPAAMISGVFWLAKLEEAQDRGLTLFWAHNLDALLEWVEGTRAT